VTFVVVRHRPGTARLHRQTRLGAVERLDLALLIDREDDRMGGRIDVEADDVFEFSRRTSGAESVNCFARFGNRPNASNH
jgi:hypothetical protein